MVYVVDLDDTLVLTKNLNNDAYNFALEQNGQKRIKTAKRLTRENLNASPSKKLITDKQNYLAQKWLKYRVVVNEEILSIVVDDKEYVFSGDKLVESGKSTWVKTTENWLVNSANILRSIKLKCKDLIGNSYLLNCVFEVAYPNGLSHIETEIDNIIYKGWDVEYSISRIDLPEFIQTK